MRYIPIALILVIFVSQILGECGYNSCKESDPKKLNIHVIAHSHDDVGWIKSADGYFLDDVQHIITNVVNSLDKNPKRKFTQVEIYYFNRWWSEQNNQTRNLVKSLVSSGQLSFANGGYTVNDEGAAHYSEIIDQMTLGLNILDKIFGKCGHPLISWQIDPFGASKEMPSLYAQMGFDGHVFNRGVFPKGEFVWRGSQDLGQSSEIFTTILHNHYSAPNGFDFEDGNDINNQNKKQKAEEVVRLAKQWNKDFGNTNQVLMPFGDDFKYKKAEHYFANLDKLLDAVKEYHPEVNMFYSNPMCYLWAVHQTNKTFPVRERDYFPLWSGFFTSRPSLKRQERMTNTLLQISKQLDSMTRIPENEPFLAEAKNEISIMTHHDAITGTSPQPTIDDYIERIFSASEALKQVVNKTYDKLLPKEESIKIIPNQIFCESLNISECNVSEKSEEFTLIIYNPIGRPISQWIRVPIVSDNIYDVFDSKGVQIKEIHRIPIAEDVLKIPGRKSSAKFELVFKANITGLGFDTFFFKKTNKNKVTNTSNPTLSKNIELKGKGFVLVMDNKTGNIESIRLEGKDYPLKQSFKFYKSNHDSSYEFCSEGNVNDIDSKAVKLESVYSSGSVHEVKQHWNDWISQTIRVYEDKEYVEFDWTVGHIPIDDKMGKEVISRFETNFNTNGVFYTDANGRQNVKRMRTTKKEKCGSFDNSISDNYYPIYSKAFIRDDQKGLQLTVLNDRTQGGSSQSDGQLELMVHRRILTTLINLNETGPDGRGLVVRGKHFLFFKPINESAKSYRDLSQTLFMSPLMTFSPLTQSQNDYKNKYKTSYSALNRDLPKNIHLLTLEKWKQDEILVRFEHFYQKEDKNELSKATQIDLKDLFKQFNIKSIREMTLSANKLLSESHRLKWKTNQLLNKHKNGLNFEAINDMKIELSPQQIRTFILTIEDHHKRVNCSLQWKTVTGNKIPANGIIGGFDTDGKSLYVCRRKQDGDLLPGKANERLGCVVTVGGKAFESKSTYEILVGHDYTWVPRHGGDAVPERAFVGGIDRNGQNIYVGRCDMHSGVFQSQVVGKIQHKFYYAFGDKEHSDCQNHQIMVC